jgi:glycosyltransferase involved in cell wall biosynthesis
VQPEIQGAARVGLLLPCRNEARVLERRLRNLCSERFPGPGPHRILVIDDHSTDGTAELAGRLAHELPWPQGVGVEVLRHTGAPGKAQALRAGLSHLTAVDLWVLSDADVVQRPGSLVALAAAFQADPRLGLACGAQEFVRDLDPSGRCLAANGGPLVQAAGRYDRLTAWVRHLESRLGMLFSVHGQLLAWRPSTGALPPGGIAADDLALMFVVRRAGFRTALVSAARFLETKPMGAPRQSQAERRAQAYFQVLEAFPGALAGTWLGRLQGSAYRHLPGAFPWLWMLLCALLALAPLLLGWPWVALLVLGAVLLFHRSPPGRDLLRLAAVIRGARRTSRGALSDSWEMPRP